MIRKILVLIFVLAISLWMSGCQQTEVHHEHHESEQTETIESEEIVVE